MYNDYLYSSLFRSRKWYVLSYRLWYIDISGNATFKIYEIPGYDMRPYPLILPNTIIYYN